MTISTTTPIKRALVRKLRASSGLGAAIAGGIHEGVAPRKVKYPFVVYQLVSAPYRYDWTGVVIAAAFDVYTFAENTVDARNVDALIAEALNEAELNVDGQDSLICRRIADLPTGPDIDAEGRRIYQVGGTYEIWTNQHL